jgi:hypothetical protein
MNCEVAEKQEARLHAIVDEYCRIKKKNLTYLLLQHQIVEKTKESMQARSIAVTLDQSRA